MILAFFEMLALRTGIVPRPGVGLLWSGLQEGANANYTQRLADHRYTLRLHGDKFEGTIDGSQRAIAQLTAEDMRFLFAR